MGALIPFAKTAREAARCEQAEEAAGGVSREQEHRALAFLLDSYRIPAIAARRPMNCREASAALQERFGIDKETADMFAWEVKEGDWDEGFAWRDGYCTNPCCAGEGRE